MATLIVTYSCIDASHRYVAPVAQGSNVRTEIVTMPGTSALVVEAPEEIVELLPDADCWVAVGEAPNANTPAASRKLLAGQHYQFHVASGDKVAVKAA